MSKKFDAIIIGSGIIGGAIGFELAKKGFKTLNIDKLPAAGFGSTGNSCAIIRTHYSTYEGVAMAYEGYHYWKKWEDYIDCEDEKGLIKFHNTGCVMMDHPDNNWASMRQHYIDVGVEFEEWDLKTLKEKIPIYSTDSFWPPTRPSDQAFAEKTGNSLECAIFTACAGYINDPQLSCHNLQRACEAKGGEFVFNAEIIEIRKIADRVAGVTLSNGEQIDAKIVVNAAGPHSFVINKMAGVEEEMGVKTKALRHEVHFVPSPEGFDFEKDGCFSSDGDNAIYFRPEVGNTILVGSEDPDCDKQEWIEDPDIFNRSVTDDQYKAQAYRLARRIPDIGIPLKPTGVADLYDCSDDWIPIYDKSCLDGFYMAVGTSGNQYKNAPVVGHLMAELIQACEDGYDHDNNPLRIKCLYTDLTINSGFYTRKRKINPDSSFSVRG
jgi:sarcosine oxidase subunit beta